MSLLVCSPLDRDWLRPLRLLTPPAYCNHDPYSLGYFWPFSSLFQPPILPPWLFSTNLSLLQPSILPLLLSLFKPALKWLSVVCNFTSFFNFRTAHTSSVFGQIASLLNPPLLKVHFNFRSLLGRPGHLASFDWFNLPFDWSSLEKSKGFFTLLR